MSDKAPENINARRAIGALGIAGILAIVAAIYLLLGHERNAEAPGTPPATVVAPQGAVPTTVTKALATGTLAAFLVRPERKPLAEITFQDGGGKDRSLGGWRGRVVLLNLWATWCAPCRKEMPALASLQSALGSDEFEVVAVSLDRAGADAAASFLAENGAQALKLYVDRTASALGAVSAVGLPATVLIDRQGNEVGRLLGPADWSSPEAHRLIKAAIAEGKAG